MELAENINTSSTWSEIHAQPGIWRDWADALEIDAIRDWVQSSGFTEVWFCGAGTSAYIGDIIAAGLPNHGQIRFRSVPSTDLVARPAYYLGNVPTRLLIVNFGRSGNSSETIGVLQATKALAPGVEMLNITCNPDGALSKTTRGRCILLPEACHDAGFAMTSSFTTMLLTALSIFDDGADARATMRKLADLADASLPVLANQISALARPKRAVFVGSGPMVFAARESALKVLELSAGQIPAIWDSTLGFRHGPKSFVNNETAIFVHLNVDVNASKYDHDLVKELKAQFPKSSILTIGIHGDLSLGTTGSAVWDAAISVLPAQLASVIWSSQLGLNIDDPFLGQSTLSRVVSGVRLHPVEAAQ